MGGVPPPPPMPGMGMPTGPPPRAAIKPRVKMRPFHWVKVPTNLLSKTFWHGLMSKGDLPLDRDRLEEIFAADETKVLKKKKKEQPKTLLDAKRGQNLGIFMSSFKMSITELDERLSALPPSDKCLALEMVQSLRKLAPTPEEFESYKKYPGDKTQLSEIDQFLMRLMEVPNLKARLDLMLTIHEFPLQFEELAPEIDVTLKACKEMLDNKKLESVLHVALSIGNYVNGGTAKGACHGFQLKTLPKMGDARGRDKKTTLLDFLVMELKRSHKGLLDFDTRLENATRAIDASVKGLSAEVEVLARDLLKIDRGAKTLKEKAGKEGGPSRRDEDFFAAINKFVNGFEEQLVKLHADVSETQDCYKKLLENYGERPTTDSEEVFGHISKFVKRYAESYAKLDDTKKEKKETYAERKAREAKEKEAKEGKPAGEAAKNKNKAAAAAPAAAAGSDAPAPKASNPFAKAKAKPEGEAAPAPSKNNPFAAAKKPAEAAGGGASSEEARLAKLRELEARKNANGERADPEMVDREGGYGGFHQEKTYEANVSNPFKEMDKHSPSVSNPLGYKHDKKKGFQAVAPQKNKPKKKDRKPPTRTGWLEKMAGKSHKWDKRFFELNTSGSLLYFKKEGGKNAGSIYLRGCPVRLDLDDPAVILIQTEGRMWMLRASSAMEAARWKEDLEFYSS